MEGTLQPGWTYAKRFQREWECVSLRPHHSLQADLVPRLKSGIGCKPDTFRVSARITDAAKVAVAKNETVPRRRPRHL